MEDDRKVFIVWIKAHKKRLLLAGVSITAIIGLILGLKNKEAIIELWATLESKLEASCKLSEPLSVERATLPVTETVTFHRPYTPPKEPFNVSQHIRNLPNGCHHSMKKKLEATAIGIELLSNQTLVNSYTKYAA